MDDHGVASVGAVERTEAMRPVAPVVEARTHPVPAASWLREKLTVHVRFFVAALFCYLAVTAWVLVSSDFLPYVTDNNESFSALFHARNMLRFSVQDTVGLTDEANSNSPAGHPYVYTHEGNFPRLPALALLILGIDRIEWQITVLAFLVGGLSTYFGFKVFSKMGGDLFAFLAVAVFSTDYLLYAQWQVNTFRVWHAFFFFVSLWCIQEVNEKNKRTIGAVLFLNALCLFYFEIVFALFAALFSVIYAVRLDRGRSARTAWIAGAIALGGAAALGLLLGQLFGHLGVQRALTDIRLTYLARSFGDASGGLEGQWRKLHFFIQNHVVYWDSGSDSPESIRGLFGRLRDGVVRVYTPFLALIVGIISLCIFLSHNVFHSVVETLRESPLVNLVNRALGPGSVPERRFLVIGFVSIHAIWFVVQSGLHNPSHISLWAGVIQHQLSGIALQAVLSVSLLLGLLLLWGGSRFSKDAQDHVSGVTWYILSGTAAFILIDAAVPGYVWNGYLARYAPIPVFVTDVWLALVLYALVVLVRQSAPVAIRALTDTGSGGSDWRATSKHSNHKSSMVLFWVSVFLLLSASLYWMALQVAYYAKLPPTAILFVKQLSRPEFKGASFVSDNYSLPIVYFTGQWAYQDQALPASTPVAGKDGIGLSISGKYIWFADRETNESYLHPQYYLCRVNPDLDVAFALLALPPNGRLSNCSQQRIVRPAPSRQGLSFRNTLVASDPSPADMWTIVRLDSKLRFVPRD